MKGAELLWDAINKIDDFLEYRYRGYTREQVRLEILKIIDNMTKEMKDEMGRK